VNFLNILSSNRVKVKGISKKYIFNNLVANPIIEAFKLPSIGTLFCFAKNAIKFLKLQLISYLIGCIF